MDWKPENPPSAKEIAAKFRDDIADGVYPPGRQLPGAKGLAKELGVALMTVQSAYKQLAEDGLVEGRQGSGTYVTDPKKGDPTASQTALGLRDLQDQLTHVTSQLSELRDRVERLEADRPDLADENQ
ncbi:winged helix-turn-helix transcriptional regulator [Streptomyces sp. PSKA54]|uniref:Winged helix-turn-helix transcriptional regulator n=1 Tax=Streptomyces himalayensis subsp. aureolus TaxID=2758039 RepID=A0A7W2D564_9ACTN|nr:winged helix-turn-helix domain-containing protein [Streptomyces himalayensis]MBA4864950.1 winged helix-turn-helix transcriptional regulator [Streptomyces himalayensis subsp. aureolus]